MSHNHLHPSVVSVLSLLLFTAWSTRALADESSPAGAKVAKAEPAQQRSAAADDRKAEPAPTPAGRPDQVRLRGGFSFEGGGVIIPDSPLRGGSASAVVPTLHLGVQLNHLIGIYYENHPLFALLAGADDEGGGIAVGFVDHNIALASLTLLDTFELGLGGGVDFYALAGCTAGTTSTGCGAGTSVMPGVHGKAAVHLGGWGGDQANRAGFSIQFAFHTSIDPDGGGVILMPLGGIGAEWF